MFVEIHTIDDVLPHISYEDGIAVSPRVGYTVIDYVFVNNNTFSNAYAQECRGLKFAPDGNILARPFHKFFNIGEKQQPQDVDWTQPHVIMDKRDGSMVHPCIIAGELVFMTRMGVTDQARLALSYADASLRAFCIATLQAGQTPIFEFTSPENRVILTYDQPEITLLAIRDTITGQYLPHDSLLELGEKFHVSVVNTFGQIEDIGPFISQARALQGLEGYVIAFASGHRMKLKADAYVLRHKALAGVAYEKNLLEWIADGALDDVLPILHDDVGERVKAYAATVLTSVRAHLDTIEALVEKIKGQDRKTCALEIQAHLDKRLQGVAFAMLDGRDGMEEMMKLIKRASHSEARVEQYRDLFGMDWFGTDLVLKEN
ncbi:MAG: RNA ligase [Aliishimia sp.]